MGADPEVFGRYLFTGRTVGCHRAQVRAAYGFREFARDDEETLAGWLAAEVRPVDLRGY